MSADTNPGVQAKIDTTRTPDPQRPKLHEIANHALAWTTRTLTRELETERFTDGSISGSRQFTVTLDADAPREPLPATITIGIATRNGYLSFNAHLTETTYPLPPFSSRPPFFSLRRLREYITDEPDIYQLSLDISPNGEDEPKISCSLYHNYVQIKDEDLTETDRKAIARLAAKVPDVLTAIDSSQSTAA